MDEFIKLGGYLVEGQPEVAHDNTLSGNGLEGSPLGLSEQVSEANDLVHSNSGTWDGVSAKLDTTATANFYTTANTANYISEVPDTYLQNTDLSTTDGKVTAISGVPLSAGSTPNYGYADNGLISAIDFSGLYATSALEAKSANAVKDHGILGYNLSSYLSQNTSYFYWMPANSPWTTADYATGIFSPLQYATGACLVMNNPVTFKGYFKGNEWFIANTVSTVGQMLRGEVHRTRGVHVSGATTAGYGFDLNISGVSGMNDTANGYNWKLERGYVSGNGAYGTWKYGHDEDAALRAVSSCDMHESAFGYDSSDNITAYNGSAFKAGGGEVPESVSAATDYVTATSANIDSTVNNVSANSGAWGGSALPISAGPGIKFEMVDNTLVASTQGPILDEITIAGTWNGREVKQLLQTGTFETNVNSDVIPVNSAYSRAEIKWIDTSNSYIFYGSTANVLPSTWVLGATGRLGSLSLLNGIVRVRSNDTINTQCTAFVTIKWCEN